MEKRYFSQNKKAGFDFLLLENLTAGLVLEGWEVKAIKKGKMTMTGSFVNFKNGEAYLVGAQITPEKTTASHTEAIPLRDRKLLLNKKEIERLSGKVQRAGCTVVALNVFIVKNKLKLEIALAKGKNKGDKRAAEKEKETRRELRSL